MVFFELYIYSHALLDIHDQTEYIGNMDVTSKEDLEKNGNHYLFIRSMEEKGENKENVLVSKILKSNWKFCPRILVGPAG